MIDLEYITKKKPKFFVTVFLSVLAAILLTISVGFSALNQDLNISGDIEYEVNSNLLYDVLKKEFDRGTYAREYTGNHHDSFTESPTKSVYYWYSNNETYGKHILNKWNVIFGGFCWQMIRTTDTGGVKLLYNGVPNNGECYNTGTAQQIGTSKFNTNSDSLAYTGYMYNTRYTYSSNTPPSNEVLKVKYMTSSSTYYYGTGVTYSNGTYTLVNVTQNTWENTYSSSAGLYTCNSTISSACSNVYYIVDGSSTAMYGVEMTNGNLLNYYNIVFGTDYIESNGTYTLTNTTTIPVADWYSDYSTYNNYYTCGDNSTMCTDIKYITATYNSFYYALSSSDNYIYAKDFTYDNATDIYILGSDRYQTWTVTNIDKTNWATHHYTCFNKTGQCQTLAYVYYLNSSNKYYINLTGGKSVEDALDEMLYSNDVNMYDSTIKTYLDNWYRDNMTSYTSYLDDTVFCYNRNQENLNTNGWNPSGGSVSTPMYFERDSLSCTNDTDKFSVSNNKAKLTYPIGLASYKELDLLNYSNLKATGQVYLIDFHYSVGGTGTFGGVTSSNGLAFHSGAYGVRPVISLKPGTEYVSGDGSKYRPYVVDTND